MRSEPSPLRDGAHTYEPSLVYTLFGVVTPHVFGSASLGYTDNVLRQDDEAPGPRRHEAFFRGTAGARLDAELREHRAELDWQGTVTEYVASGDLDTLEQRLHLRLDLEFNDVSVHGDAGWTRSAYPQSIQLQGLVRLDTYDAGSWVQVDLNRFGARAGASFQRQDFLGSRLRFLDGRTLGGELQLYARFTDKLRALVEYGYQAFRFDLGRRGQLNDFDVHRVSAGVDGSFTPKLSASAKVGYAVQRVDDALGRGDRAYAGFVASLAGRWEPVQGTTFGLSYRRDVSVSTQSNGLVTDAVDATAEQRLFDEKVRLSASAGWSRSNVATGKHIAAWRFGAQASWQVRPWLSLALAWDTQRVMSQFPLGDYETNTVFATVGVGF